MSACASGAGLTGQGHEQLGAPSIAEPPGARKTTGCAWGDAFSHCCTDNARARELPITTFQLPTPSNYPHRAVLT